MVRSIQKNEVTKDLLGQPIHEWVLGLHFFYHQTSLILTKESFQAEPKKLIAPNAYIHADKYKTDLYFCI